MKNKTGKEARQSMKYVRMLLGMLAVLLAAGAVWLTVTFRGELPVLLLAPETACRRVEETMDALCSGDYTAAEELLYGMPDLGVDALPEDTVNRMLWDAYRSSLDYQLTGELYTTQQGLARNVKIIHMELPAVTEKLGQRAKELLQQRVEAAQDASEVYDASHGYRENVVAEVLEEAVRQALEEDVRYTYEIVPLRLVCRDGQWWVMPDKALLNAVFGGITE